MAITNKNILISGASGLVGSWLVESLLKENNITGIALDSSMDYLLRSKKIDKSFNIIYQDISNFDRLSDIFTKSKPDIVIHLAAQTQVGDSVTNPVRTFESNIQGTWNILELCKNAEIPVLNASSDKAYGESKNLPYTERHDLNAIYPYEVSKAIGDSLSKSYAKTYGLNITTIRCGNIYGGGDLNWNRLIPGVIRALIEKEKPVLRSDGNFTRDWVYVGDVVSAYKALAFNILENNEKVSDFYNFSSTEYYSVLDIYKELCNLATNKYVEPIFKINSDYEIRNQKLDSSKIKNELGIFSKETISSGLKKTFNWYKSNKEIYAT